MAESVNLSRPVVVYPNFLFPERCRDLIEDFCHVVESSVPAGQRSPVRITTSRREVDGRYLAAVSLRTATILSGLRARAVRLVRQHYDVQGDLTIEFTLLTEMGPGDFHPPHADNERQAADDTWIPNHTPTRDYVAMLYLNASGADYFGGIIRFPDLDQQIVPATGALVAFMCGHEHKHEVTPVERGLRFSVSMWMTRDRFSAEPWHERRN